MKYRLTTNCLGECELRDNNYNIIATGSKEKNDKFI